MMFSAKRDDLNKVLSAMQSVVERKTPVSVLANVKITARGDNTLYFLATDMDICAEDKIAGIVEAETCITLPATTLYEIVRKIQVNTDVKFLADENAPDAVQILIESSAFSLPTIDPAEFPSFEDPSNMLQFEIAADVLKTLLNKTKHAISNDETRYYLNGIYVHSGIGEDGLPMLAAVATDGHRLAFARTILPEGAREMPGVIIPKKAVAEICKMLDGYSGMVNVSINSKKIICQIGTATITSKLIDGKFPDYQRVIPKGHPHFLKVSTVGLTQAVELVTAVSNDKTKTVRFTVGHDSMSVNASSEMNGNARGQKQVPVEANINDPVPISFNSRYLLDVMGAIEGDTTNMQFNNSIAAVALQDASDENCLYVLMPMQ
jgi:DNA polymerase-3 subunit beta